MKKLMMVLAALFAMNITASAMSYEKAREQALFLTDKMAYELNLTEDQYEAAYEVNLDYLMSINTYDDLYGVYWRNRNLDLSYILLDWQYRAFCDASYFYRPLYWSAGAWHFGIYARYPHRTFFYFGRPHFYVSYTGGHSWRMNGGRSWYHGRTFGNSHRIATNNHGIGMRDGYRKGNGPAPGVHNDSHSGGFRNNGSRGHDRNGADRQSSTRTTVRNTQHGQNAGSGSGAGFGGGRPSSKVGSEAPANRFSPGSHSGTRSTGSHSGGSHGGGHFGGRR